MCNIQENLTHLQGKAEFYYDSATQAIYKDDCIGLWMLPAKKIDIQEHIFDNGQEDNDWAIQIVSVYDKETNQVTKEADKIILCDFEDWLEEYWEAHAQEEITIPE